MEHRRGEERVRLILSGGVAMIRKPWFGGVRGAVSRECGASFGWYSQRKYG